MTDTFLAIILYFQTLAGFGPMAVGNLPMDSPLAPPGPNYTPPAIRVSVCQQVPYAP